MKTPQDEARSAGRCPVAHGFDAMGDDYYRDPAGHLATVRDTSPVFWYPHLNAWIVTRREDCLTVLSDWQTYSSAANSAADVPAKHQEVYPPDLVAKMIVGQDPPGHTETRSVAQRGFVKERMDRLQPEIEARAHRIIDRFENNGSANLLEEYSLELTTQTIMALLGLGYEHEAMMRQLRDDLFAVLSSAHEPLPEPARSEVWDRFVEANLKLRAVVEERRDSEADDIISVMASARAKDGSYALPTPQIALHVSEFAAAGTDTTAQAMTNAVLFLARNPGALEDALAEPELWPRVFEETVRRRPSSTFTSRRATRDVELSGVRIPAGDMVWVALASANTDPGHVERPFEFDIHRPDPTDHLAFTAGRHTCLGNPLARVQGATGLRVLFERLPSLRPDDTDALDFLRMALLPVRRSLRVRWDVADVERSRTRTVRTLNLEVTERTEASDGVVALTLSHPDGGELPPWKAGAHIDVHVPGGDGEVRVRQYSLCSDPEDRTSYRVGVLREQDGRGGSAAVHDTLTAGSRVTVSWPRNNFRLLPSPRYLFIAGGIGVTPVLPMIREAERAGAEWELVYGGRTQASMAFRDELAVHGERVTVVPQDELGLIDLPGLLGEVREGTLVYACGPEPLLRAVEENTAHWPKNSLRLERFAPKPVVRTVPDTPFEVEFAGSGTVVEVGADETILEAAEKAGLPVVSSCKTGTCGTCETPIVSGRADHRDSILTPSEQEADRTMLLCVSRAAAGCPRLVLGG
ncbi:cytochrome P450/oxidoreductase [Streptomyces sp. SLBN-134]|uniref:cytochrome P450/oxidoreductase n=1 Tax=Streptomyces sp. SLBN-134 TaxID=2768456 RepID=UPI00116EF72F|nr:cytochrome P450/oxidoreductase [Streptomyces sp. SLBN-134]TQL18285.1 cytochrome P450 [Streptomyces sp. SLBN-134]